MQLFTFVSGGNMTARTPCKRSKNGSTYFDCLVPWPISSSAKRSRWNVNPKNWFRKWWLSLFLKALQQLTKMYNSNYQNYCCTDDIIQTHSATPSHSLLASLHWLPIHQQVTSKLASQVYPNLHDTSPAYLSSLLHAYELTIPLWACSAHLLAEPQNYTCFSGISDLSDHISGTLVQITPNLLPLSSQLYLNWKFTSSL